MFAKALDEMVPLVLLRTFNGHGQEAFRHPRLHLKDADSTLSV